MSIQGAEDAWGRFTQMQEVLQSGAEVIVGAEGCSLRDANGKEMIDGLAGLHCVNVGHART